MPNTLTLTLASFAWIAFFIPQHVTFFEKPGIVIRCTDSQSRIYSEIAYEYFPFKQGWLLFFCFLILLPFGKKIIRYMLRDIVSGNIKHIDNGKNEFFTHGIQTHEREILDLKKLEKFCVMHTKQYKYEGKALNYTFSTV